MLTTAYQLNTTETTSDQRETWQNHPNQLETRYDSNTRALWCYMNPYPRPCFNPTLLSESRKTQRQLVQRAESGSAEPVDYLILASHVPGVFNLGGDLGLFLELIRQRDAVGLMRYARACIDVCYNQAINLNLPLTTIALIQGDALGGGFEAALSCGVLIAERKAQMGLPEILFNLFPGMGAYSFLARRLDPIRAERIILSGKLYSAEELYDMGIVDVLVEDGQGEKAVCDYIKKRNRSRNGYIAMQKVRRRYNPLSYDELMDTAKIWVDAALQLSAKDLKVMERLVRAQDRRKASQDTERVNRVPA